MPKCRWTRPEGGLFVWMTVPEDLDTSFEGPLFPQCVEEGVSMSRVTMPSRPSRAGTQEPPPPHIRRSERVGVGRGRTAIGGGVERMSASGRMTVTQGSSSPF